MILGTGASIHIDYNSLLGKSVILNPCLEVSGEGKASIGNCFSSTWAKFTYEE